VNPYHGFTWNSFSAYTAFPGFPGFNNSIVSAPNAAYSGGEIAGPSSTFPIVGSITSAIPFDFVSAWLGAGYYDNLQVTVDGYFGGSLQFTQTVTVDTAAPQFFSFAFTGIDELNFSSGTTGSTTDPFGCGTFNCTQFTLDNATFDAPWASSVPEPSSFVLLGLGVVALFRARRV
jgi:hypothetical protein